MKAKHCPRFGEKNSATNVVCCMFSGYLWSVQLNGTHTMLVKNNAYSINVVNIYPKRKECSFPTKESVEKIIK